MASTEIYEFTVYDRQNKGSHFEIDLTESFMHDFSLELPTPSIRFL